MTIGNSRFLNFGDLGTINQEQRIEITGSSTNFSTTDFDVINTTNFPGLSFNTTSIQDFSTFDAPTGEVTLLKRGIVVLSITFNFNTASQTAEGIATVEIDTGGGFTRLFARSDYLSKAGDTQSVNTSVFEVNPGNKFRVAAHSASNSINLITRVNVSPAYTIPAGLLNSYFAQT